MYRIAPVLFAVLVSFSLPASAQPPSNSTVDRELIVLLYSGPPHPTPQEVLDAINNGDALVPGGLGEGNPMGGWFAVSRRARGAMADYYDAHPGLAAARLQRYIVLRYPNENAVPGILTALSNNPNVEHVERNRPIRYHAIPSDSFFPPNGDPEAHQWGPNLLDLPDAWDLMEGHATIGLIDTGVQPGHPDLEPFDDSDIVPVFLGGNFREHWSYDFLGDDCNVDEQEGVPPSDIYAGHGMHVAGIAAATTDNSLGVAGTCWNCPFAMAQVWEQNVSVGLADSADALDDFRVRGLQIVSMSFGIPEDCDNSQGPSQDFFCVAIEAANDHDMLLAASSGNDLADVEWPANDPRVIAVGGIAPGGIFWDQSPDDCPGFDPGVPLKECGSNFGPDQELVAPAQSVLSTVYTGLEHIDPVFGIPCGDDTGNAGTPNDGFGLCTGTSMSSPAVAGIAGLLRSTNPLLSQQQIRDILTSTASGDGTHTDQLGYGYPDAGAAAEMVLGQVNGVQQSVRLTPFFGLYSSIGQAHLYTTSPQRAAAGIEDLQGATFASVGPAVSGYPAFPGAPGETPSASVYVFSTPSGPPGLSVVPLYRLTKDSNRPLLCDGLPQTETDRAFAYATSNSDILQYRENYDYDLDGIEGYLIDPSEIPPADAVAMHRLYNSTRDDWAIVPETELPLPGYVATPPFDEVIGYAYPNVDSDGDGMIDGLESLVGTDVAMADSDCDGLSDGAELLGLGGGSLSDPLSQLGCLFNDGFETGDTSRWSSTVGET